MAAALNRTKLKGRYRPLSEINVTPMVDVMLVLLVIFMVTAPLMTAGVPVDLPKTSAQPLNADSEPVTVSINAEGKIYLQEAEVQLGDLVPKLQELAHNDPDRRIFVRGDKELAYGRIMEVMGTVTQGGFTKVALLAEQPSAPPATPLATPPATPSASGKTGAAKPSSTPSPAAPPAAGQNRKQGSG